MSQYFALSRSCQQNNLNWKPGRDRRSVLQGQNNSGMLMLLWCSWSVSSFGLPVSQSFVLVNKFLIINNILSTKLLAFPMSYFPSWGGGFFHNSFLCWKCKLSEFVSCSCSFSPDFSNVWIWEEKWFPWVSLIFACDISPGRNLS